MTAPVASSLGLLLYTQIPIKQNKPSEICFLLWKHNKTTQHQSAAYWSQMICTPAKTDQSAVETLARSFSLQTNGLFASQSKSKPAAKSSKSKSSKSKAKEEELDLDDPLRDVPLRYRERIRESITRMDDKIRKMKGIVVIANASQRVYVVPVPYVPCWELNAATKAHGEARWVTAEEFYATIKSDSASASLVVVPLPSTEAKFQQLAEAAKEPTPTKKPTKTPAPSSTTTKEEEDEEEKDESEDENDEKEEKRQIKSQVEEKVPLYLPFVSLLRTKGVLDEITNGLRDFKIVIKEGDKKLDPKLIAESDQVDRVGLVGPDVAKQLAETLQIDGKKREVTLEVYTCRKCRKLLFTQGDLAPHSMASQDLEQSTERTVHFRNKSVKPRGAVAECTSIFINRVSALGEFSEVEGKIFCPKCKCRIGTYTWPGIQCSCGSWVVPALQITKSKVDVRGRRIDL